MIQIWQQTISNINLTDIASFAASNKVLSLVGNLINDLNNTNTYKYLCLYNYKPELIIIRDVIAHLRSQILNFRIT